VDDGGDNFIEFTRVRVLNFSCGDDEWEGRD